MDLKKELVIKSNKLIDMQTDLNLIQLKIFTKVILSTVQNPKDEYCRFSIKELMNDFNITETHYTALKIATKNMIKAVILKTINGEIQLPLFTKVAYCDGIVDMYLHPELKPYILNIKTRYTKYFFKNITGLNSIYSMRLYELLKQYEFRWNRSFDISELRFLLNVWEGKYKRHTDFRKRIILQTQKELKEKTDISFEFTERREGRRVIEIIFKIFSKNQNSLKKQDENTLNTILKTKIFLSDKQIKTVLKQYDEKYIKRNIDYTLLQKNIKNIAWYFGKALEQDYWQTLFLQQEQKKQKLKEIDEKLFEEQKQQKLKKEQDKIKKQKIEDFIQNREEEVLELIPDFIEANKFLLQKLNIDLGNTQELLKIIKWENTTVKGVKNLFIGFISHKFK